MRIRIAWGSGEAAGTLDDTATGRALYEVMPCHSVAHTWGAEVFFEVPVKAELDAAPKVVVPRGTICFWVQGCSVALPYGPTPISEGKECRLVTAVNVLGKLDGDPSVLAAIQDGDEVQMERLVEDR